ncbi:hypothetical protein GDO86_017968 [Hymenochirus boettgeri]|uniref:Gamma-glutamyltransferase 7 n=1 Tax=Hymenochirus boettgeri TaxID=247094 RepID=A0A8T2IIH0_9PIPI|nr:hypothetical protein GDO86_017968 [Hymenochirus boettgeri]
MVALGFVFYELKVFNLALGESGQTDPDGIQGDESFMEEEHENHHHEHNHENEVEKESGHHHESGTYHHAIAVTDSDSCSRAGKEILQAGGSVIDAAITAVLCLAVVHPHTTSLGGVFSTIFYNGTSAKASILNAVPHEASPERFGVPVTLQGLHLLHQKFGLKPWPDLFHAAIKLANEGFTVDAALGQALEIHQHVVHSSVGLCKLFCESSNSSGRLKGEGDLVRNPLLGTFLEQVSNANMNPTLLDTLSQSLPGDTDPAIKEKLIKTLSKVPFDVDAPLTLHMGEMTLFTSGGQTAGKILKDLMQKTSGNETTSVDWTTGGSMAPVGSNVIMAQSNGHILVMSLSLNSSFGSGVVSPSSGILFSDFVQGTDSIFWACPAVITYGTDGDVMGLAATGGSSVPSSIAQVFHNHLYLKKNITESVLDSMSNEHGSGPTKYPLTAMAVEVEAEHLHVAKSIGLCCHYEGL